MDVKLYYAAGNGDVAAMLGLLLSGADPNVKSGVDSETALHAACRRRNLMAAQTLLVAKATVDARSWGRRTPLHLACCLGHPEIVETLCHAGANVDALDTWKETPLMLACKMNDYDDVVEILLEKGAKLNFANRDTKTALHYAAASGACRCMIALLEKGADIEARTRTNNTPLHWASSHDHLGAVKKLVQRGADIFSKGREDETALDKASESRIIYYLLEQYKEKIVENKGPLSLHAILQEVTYSGSEAQTKIGNLTIDRFVSLLELIHSQDPDWIRSQDNNRSLPLHIACHTNAPLKVLTFLIDQDPSTLHMINRAGCLAIHEGCRGRMPLEKIKYLVEKGGVGTLGGRDTRCFLPLHVACESKPPVDVIKYLQKMYPVSVLEKTSAGVLPVMLATEGDASADVLHVLLTAYPEAAAFMKTYYNPEK